MKLTFILYNNIKKLIESPISNFYRYSYIDINVKEMDPEQRFELQKYLYSLNIKWQSGDCVRPLYCDDNTTSYFRIHVL